MAFGNGANNITSISNPHFSKPSNTTPLPNPKADMEAKKRRKHQGALIGLRVAATPMASNKDMNQGGEGFSGTGKAIGPKSPMKQFGQ